jgi:processive 1,2-diacylglycerol beta-glucosyltransferase
VDHSKKVLILYASAGHGHEKAAKALEETYKQLYPGRAVLCEDVLELASGFLGSFYESFYLWQIQKLPWLWGIFYHLLDIGPVYRLANAVRRVLNAAMSGRLETLLIRESPAVVLATHFLPIEVADHLKKKGRISSKLVAVVTDYLPHYIWTAPTVDFYVVAAEETREALALKGVDASKIKVLGIPVEPKFSKALSRSSLRERFGLSGQAFTVLVTSGGAGIGALALITGKLCEKDSQLQLMVVCGTNAELERNMRALAARHAGLKVFGFVNNMDELMEAADLVVGKGGGLTLTESFAKGKPVVLFRPVPGQESRNGRIVKKNSAGFVTQSPAELADRVYEIAHSAALYASLKKRVQKLSRPEASRDIVELAEHAACH